MSSCCQQPSPEPPPPEGGSCCGGGAEGKRKFDWLLWGSLIVALVAVAAHLLGGDQLAELPRIAVFTHGVTELLSKMWWGLLLGVVAITALSLSLIHI